MSFTATNLAAVQTVVSNSKRITVWVYDSSDDILAAGYFADAGSTSGDSRLTAGDVIINPTTQQIVVVSDAAAGTARAAVGGGRKLLKIPVAASASSAEQDTTVDLPTQGLVFIVFIDVTTAEATGTTKTIDVGLLSSESGGDADGFLDGVSVAATGLVTGAPTVTDGTNQNYVSANTLGVLLYTGRAGTDAAGDAGCIFPRPHKLNGTAKSVTYTFGSNNFAEFAGFICIEYIEVA